MLSGKLVVVAEGVSKSFDDRPIVKKLDLRVLRGDRLGIVGPNGAGKSTLLKLFTGLETPDAGSIKLGTNLNVITLDQQRAALNPAVSLADTLTGGKSDMVQVGDQSRHVIGYMKDFLFKPEQARTPVGTLSGGERGRLLLAVALAKPSNLLILDEPTNDLDLETLDLLQEMLGDYPGTVLLVSHDRDFLDRVASSTLAAEGEGRWVEYAGGYTDMLAQRGEVVAAAKAKPARAAARAGRGQARCHSGKTLFQATARVEDAERRDRAPAGRDQAARGGAGANRTCTAGISKPSTASRRRWRRRRRGWARLRNAGSSWKCCAKAERRKKAASFCEQKAAKKLFYAGPWAMSTTTPAAQHNRSFFASFVHKSSRLPFTWRTVGSVFGRGLKSAGMWLTMPSA